MKMHESLKIDDTHCVGCGENLNGCAAVSEDDPRAALHPNPGDVAICMICETVNVYGENLKLRRPTDEEMAKFEADPEVRYVRAATRQVNRERMLSEALDLMLKGLRDDDSAASVPGGDARSDPGQREGRSEAPGAAGSDGERKDQDRG